MAAQMGGYFLVALIGSEQGEPRIAVSEGESGPEEGSPNAVELGTFFAHSTRSRFRSTSASVSIPTRQKGVTNNQPGRLVSRVPKEASNSV